MSNQSTLLIISHDVVGKSMAGPGIRYYHLARTLAKHCNVTLAIPDESPAELPLCDFAVVRYNRRNWLSLAPHLQSDLQPVDVCLFPSDIASDMPELGSSNACLVVDGYDPLLVEWLTLNTHFLIQNQLHWWRGRMAALTQQFLLGDFFICASERQRDWWLGMLEAHGRINPATFNTDPSLRSLIDVVAYGLPETAPVKTRPVIKGVWPGINPEDKVLLWGGGLWPWLDPVTAVRAVAKLWATRQDIRLIFPGTRHPNPMMAQIPTQTEAAKAAAQEAGLEDRAIFFGDWLPYSDWSDVLLESDVALSLHFDTLETRLAFRSRMLEYIWAGLPIVATRGDATSELIAHHQLGVVTEYGDVDGVAAGIQQLLEEPANLRQANFVQARSQLSWERAIAPLVAFCKNPRRAADKGAIAQGVGNPYYVDSVNIKPHHAIEFEQLRQERDHWQRLAEGYARGRVMRVFNKVDQLTKFLRSTSSN